jgi:hypothetical protein
LNPPGYRFCPPAGTKLSHAHIPMNQRICLSKDCRKVKHCVEPSRTRLGGRKLILRTEAGGVLFGFGTMRRMRHLFDAHGRKLGACVCLVAVVMLWAPLWASALQAAGMACCDGAMCPLHGHAPKKSSGDSNATKGAPMGACEHQGRGAAMDCTMACCHPAETSMSAAIFFVVPSPPKVSVQILIGPAPPTLSSLASSYVFDPASPPPRTLLLGL